MHAASLENQFVANGFSHEQYGRALFTNDFVLAGPTSDPAGVSADGSHNIVQAFADIAAAGINGGARRRPRSCRAVARPERRSRSIRSGNW